MVLGFWMRGGFTAIVLPMAATRFDLNETVVLLLWPFSIFGLAELAEPQRVLDNILALAVLFGSNFSSMGLPVFIGSTFNKLCYQWKARRKTGRT